MTQVLFAAATAPLETDLDANFLEVYTRTKYLTTDATRTTISTVGGAGSPYLATGQASDQPYVETQRWNGSGSNYGGTRLVGAGNGAMAFLRAADAVVASQTWIESGRFDNSGNLRPGVDNSQTLGAASFRWSTVYAGTGTINTSDAREKTAVTPLTTSEIAAAQDLVQHIGTYQWLAAVQAKNEGDARKHVGMTVQQAIAVMTSHGLDPMAYGFICYDAWQEERDLDGSVTLPAGDRYSFRPDELGMFIARGVAASLAAIDARLTTAGF